MNKMIFIIALLITFNVHAIDFEKREKYFRSVSTCFKGVYVQGDLMAVGTSYQDILLINYQTGKEKSERTGKGKEKNKNKSKGKAKTKNREFYIKDRVKYITSE